MHKIYKLILIGFFIIRPEVPEAVATCQKAGIKVRMVTGDNKITALAIGKEWGILTEDVPDAVLEGPVFYERVGGLYCKNCDQASPWQWPEKKVIEAVRNKEEFIKNMEESFSTCKIETRRQVFACYWNQRNGRRSCSDWRWYKWCSCS